MVNIGNYVFYSSEETAKLLGVTLRTLQKWATDDASRPDHLRDLNPITTPNGKRLFQADEIHTLLGRIYRIDFNSEIARQILQNEKPVRGLSAQPHVLAMST
jgi:DNA-binding transcriptional MerR regulator